MNRKSNNFYFLLILFYFLFLFIYLNSFLLTKKEINQINFFNSNKQNKNNKKQKINKIIFFIIDALRYDFITSNNLNHLNNNLTKFQVIHNLLLNNSSQCNLYKFKADSPTTTSQRLNGIMTGSLPTFIEFGNNFQSSQIIEDSLIKQWKLNNKKIIMLGDDTWEKLFPDQFDISYPFDSFNTRDLDTVDYGILNNLWQFFSNNQSLNNWDILITHFLGVDHIGHTYHAHHPLMNERLSLMNKILEQFIENLSNDSLLILMGDHGMTIDGEHGL